MQAESTLKIYRLGLKEDIWGWEVLGLVAASVSIWYMDSRCLISYSCGNSLPSPVTGANIFSCSSRHWGPRWDACPCRSHFPTSLRTRPKLRMANWELERTCVWDTGSIDSAPPISRFPITWANKFICKLRLSCDSCYLFWWNTFPFHSCLLVRSFGLLRLGPSCQGQLPADRCRISIILSPLFNSTISPLESLTPHHLSLPMSFSITSGKMKTINFNQNGGLNVLHVPSSLLKKQLRALMCVLKGGQAESCLW